VDERERLQNSLHFFRVIIDPLLLRDGRPVEYGSIVLITFAEPTRQQP
jgi:hypothetical protein